MQIDIRELRQAKNVWIYGAGVIGKRTLDLIFNKLTPRELFPLSVKGIVVSKLLDGQTELDGFKIVEIEDVKTPKDDTVFIIAVSEKHQGEIIRILLDKGYQNYILWNEKKFMTGCWCLADYQFDDRRRGFKKVCFVLSGYKEFLWGHVFERLIRYIPKDIDVCILSSGLRSSRLSQMAEYNGWSYLSTKVNDLTLIQNVAMALFDQAEWIYKMDEDIFTTDQCFENLLKMYNQVAENEPYRVGFVAPLIPVNGYGYIRILKYLGQLPFYEQKFGRAIYGGNAGGVIESNGEVARFMWGEDEKLPRLDDLNKMVLDNREYSVCGVRFSIGFILFKRGLWDGMRGFPVSGSTDLGEDEEEICRYCILRSYAAIVAENTVVGHFSFGRQTEAMRDLLKKKPELFQIRQDIR